MKIGVLSDTHIPKSAGSLPPDLLERLAGVDLILHAGDITEGYVLDTLSKLAPVRAVYGNMDEPSLEDRLPGKDTINVNGLKIGLIHGWGPPFGLINRIRQSFGKVDVIVYGHTHKADNTVRDGVLFFNPGTPTDNVFARSNSFGILDIKGGKIKGEIVKL